MVICRIFVEIRVEQLEYAKIIIKQEDRTQMYSIKESQVHCRFEKTSPNRNSAQKIGPFSRSRCSRDSGTLEHF